MVYIILGSRAYKEKAETWHALLGVLAYKVKTET